MHASTTGPDIMKTTPIRHWLITALMLLTPAVMADRVKDLASIGGVRNNQLVGYGLVVGLIGSGDKNLFTSSTLRNMLLELGVTLPDGENLKAKNVAAVSVHTNLPPFAKIGQTLDVTVSSLGDAKGLRGGSLLMTPLKGADGQIYAIAQGSVISGGVAAQGEDGSKIVVNVPSSGSIPNGATVEREVPTSFTRGEHITLNLHNPDFTTSNRVAETINKTYGGGTAQPIDAASIRINAPRDPSQRVSFTSMLENLELDPAETSAKVIVNSRTGTVVISNMVRVQPVAVTHGNLTVTVKENLNVSQPNAFSNGQTVVAPNSNVSIDEDGKRMWLFNSGVSLDEIVKAVNRVGLAPSDLVAIIQALKSSGALRAELIVI
ncbi:MAG: hypothetical protein RIQ52_549 [Pseudomonadota bacterium]